MKFITTQTEINATINMVMAIVEQMPRGDKRRELQIDLEDLQSAFDHLIIAVSRNDIDSEAVSEAIATLNNLCVQMRGDMAVLFSLDDRDQVTMTLELDEEIIAKATDYLTSEIPSLAGMGIMIYGMAKTFGANIIRVGRGLDKILGGK